MRTVNNKRLCLQLCIRRSCWACTIAAHVREEDEEGEETWEKVKE